MTVSEGPLRVCLLTGGGDAPGLNAAVRAFYHVATLHSIRVWASQFGFEEEKRRVLNENRVRLDHRLPQSDRRFVEAAKRHDGGAHTLGAETGKCLGKLALVKRGDRQKLRGCRCTLTPTAVKPNLEHGRSHSPCRPASQAPREAVFS